MKYLFVPPIIENDGSEREPALVRPARDGEDGTSFDMARRKLLEFLGNRLNDVSYELRAAIALTQKEVNADYGVKS